MTGAPRSYNDGFERVSALKRPEPPSGSKAGGAKMTNLLLLDYVQIAKDANMVSEELKLRRLFESFFSEASDVCSGVKIMQNRHKSATLKFSVKDLSIFF